MVIVPFAFNVSPVGTVIPVKVISAGRTAAPFNKSLLRTEVVVAPVYPLIGPNASATASIAAAEIVSVTVA